MTRLPSRTAAQSQSSLKAIRKRLPAPDEAGPLQMLRAALAHAAQSPHSPDELRRLCSSEAHPDIASLLDACAQSGPAAHAAAVCAVTRLWLWAEGERGAGYGPLADFLLGEGGTLQRLTLALQPGTLPSQPRWQLAQIVLAGLEAPLEPAARRRLLRGTLLPALALGFADSLASGAADGGPAEAFEVCERLTLLLLELPAEGMWPEGLAWQLAAELTLILQRQAAAGEMSAATIMAASFMLALADRFAACRALFRSDGWLKASTWLLLNGLPMHPLAAPLGARLFAIPLRWQAEHAAGGPGGPLLLSLGSA